MSKLRPPEQLSFAESHSLAERWRMWAEEMRLYLDLTMNKDTEKDKCSAFLYIIGRSGREIFNTWHLNEDEKDKIDILFEKFDRYCKPKQNITLERYRFNSRVQRTNESLDEFVTDLKKLAKLCRYQALEEEMIKDRIVVGINNQTLKERLLREPELTLEQAVLICRADEESKKGLSLIAQKETVTVDALHKSKGFTKPYKQNKHHRQMMKTENCSKCGTRHPPRACPAYGKTCHNCKGANHFSSVCKSKRKKSVKQIQAEELDSQESDNEFYIGAINGQNKQNDWHLKLSTTTNKSFNVKLDTGAQANVMSEATYKKIGSNPSIKATAIRLTAYSGEKIPVIGEVQVPCKYKDKIYKINFIVTPGNSHDVLGLKACQEMNLIQRINTVEQSSAKNELLIQYSDVFTGLGCLESKYHIEVDKNVNPVHCQARKIPLSLQDRVKEELKRMEDMGVVEKQTQHTDWASPMVVVEKQNKKLRLCMDPQQLNRAIKRDKYSIPDPEEIKAKLGQAKFFTKFDATSGFWHIPLDEESSKMCTMTTPFGKYSFLRCPFGISSAPEIFNQRVKQIYGNEEGMDSFFDDILVWGRTKEELRTRERRCLELARKANLRFNKDKSLFCQTEVKYLGHIISDEGSKPDPQKVEAIKSLKITDKPSLQRYLGMVTYVGKYIENLSQKTEVLRRLLKKNIVWEWTPEHEDAVEQINSTIAKSPTLSHFNIDKQVTITCDASQFGLGAALLQEEKVIAYASRTLTESERNYAQIEKEALSVVFACEKFHQFIYGRKVHVENDHKPLEFIFKKSIVQCPPRIQRFMLRLQKYDIHYQYKPGKELVIADTLSRAPQNGKFETEMETEAALQVNLMISQLAISPEKQEVFKRETARDTELVQLRNQIQIGWPERRQEVTNNVVNAYWDVREALTEHNGLIFKDDRVVVPRSLRKDMMSRIHEGHLGIERCQRRAREIFYWPKISADIREMVSTCYECLKHRNRQQKQTLIWHETGEYPWQKLGADIFHLDNRNFLLIVDYLSKYVEMAELKDMRSNTLIGHMKNIFSRHGIPETVMTDNAQNFTSTEFQNFMREWEIHHVTSSPRFPQSNGLVERTVQTMKKILKKSKDEDIHLALLNYRSSPMKDLPSPAEILMGRKLRTRLPEQRSRLQTQTSKQTKKTLIKRQKQREDKGKDLRPLSVGDHVFMRNPDDTHWQPAVVLKRATTPRSYIVQNNNTAYRRNRQQLLKPNVQSYVPTDNTTSTNNKLSINYDDTSTYACNTSPESRSTPTEIQTQRQPKPSMSGNLDHSTRLQVEFPNSPNKQVQPQSSPVGSPSSRSNPQTKQTHYKTRSGRVVQKPNKYTD